MREPTVRHTATWALALLAATALSLALTYCGLLALALSAMCYDPGPSPQATACAQDAYLFTAMCAATLLIPVAIATWTRRAPTPTGVRNRLAICLLFYLPPVLILVISILTA
ncbi:hypothetical protein [Pseudonocardia acaciae]|uniref:hypothetical protein n=1 Tax=Pseudonocardia acaciae TaxID=551276 RepID=UPI0004907277|nr:hypothetical protein [Pseudonocardia acaciae]